MELTPKPVNYHRNDPSVYWGFKAAKANKSKTQKMVLIIKKFK